MGGVTAKAECLPQIDQPSIGGLIAIESNVNILKSKIGYVPGVGKGLFFINYLFQKFFRLDSDCPFIKNYTSRVLHADKIEVDSGCSYVLKSFQVSGGCYIVGNDGIRIGSGTIWAPNVSIISGTHDFKDFDFAPSTKGIRIGSKCWIGAGAVILPGVTLGDHTIVGANAVVTHSFETGNVVIAGAPAKIIRTL